MTRLYLIRHAEAEGNLYRRIHGQYDSLITENGYRQIAALRGRFQHIPINAVYSSDLFRAATTAKAIYGPRGLTLITRKALREVDMGRWEDRPWGEVARVDRARLALFNQTSPLWQAEEGEGFGDIRARVTAALRQIVKHHPNQTVAVVSHGMAIRNALAFFHGLSVEESAGLGHSDNTAVSLVEFDDAGARVIYENDNSHLPEEISTLGQQQWWRERSSIFDSNMWFRPLDMARDAALYRDARREAWLNIHGSLLHYDENAFFNDALAHWQFDGRSVMCAMLGDQITGLLQLDLRRDAEKGVGYIPFFYMTPDYRAQGLGVQLLGQAVSTYRPLLRTYLRLRCAPDNFVAQRFYQRHGFRKVAEDKGSRVPLDVMEKYIGY
ncbi:MAG: GNAT family N-acetyltransferase [Clostridiales bacterium]|nr:GNAT family N-acetyltransferase [Clostridiales bacterium]